MIHAEAAPLLSSYLEKNVVTSSLAELTSRSLMPWAKVVVVLPTMSTAVVQTSNFLKTGLPFQRSVVRYSVPGSIGGLMYSVVPSADVR